MLGFENLRRFKHQPFVTSHPFVLLGSLGERLTHCCINISEISEAVIRACNQHCQLPAQTSL